MVDRESLMEKRFASAQPQKSGKRLSLNEMREKLITEDVDGRGGLNPTSPKANLVRTCINNTLKGVYNLTEADLNIPMGDMNTTKLDGYTPVIIDLIRRTMPTLIGPDIIGTQALTTPTGRIFAQRIYARDAYGNAGEFWQDSEHGPDPRLSAGGQVFDAAGNIVARKDKDPFDDASTRDFEAYNVERDARARASYAQNGRSGSTVDSDINEGLGWKPFDDTTWYDKPYQGRYAEMSFGIDSIDVSARTRKLKGSITTEVIEDLKSIHNLDAETELANILETEIVAEIDREIISRIYFEAVPGAQNCSTPGTFSFALDADGRWTAEKVISLMLQLEREATIIAQQTRRGRGNFIVTSPEVAAYLSTANLLSIQIQNSGFTPEINPVGVSYYGMLANHFKVYVDPYLSSTDNKHIMLVGYKGQTEQDAGLIYCPYIPITFYKSEGVEDFGKRIGVQSRYGLVSNPWMCDMSATTTDRTAAAHNKNKYYRKFIVDLSSLNQ